MKEITANIIFQHNAYGLSNDAKLLVKYLDQVLFLGKDIKIKVRAVNTNSFDTTNVDINFFLEVMNPLLFHTAKVNVLIPNQEWFYDHWTPYLDNIDYIWCKSDTAYELFRDTGKAVHIGWVSEDKFKCDVKKNNDFVHIAGSSIYKGTQRLIDHWQEQLPILHVYYNKNRLNIKEKQQSNIKYHSKYISDEDMTQVMNTYRFHLCLSECEGFGHYIYESLGCKNIVFTTDTLPISNTIDKICVVKTGETISIPNTNEKRCLFDVDDFNDKLSNILSRDDNNYIKLGDSNRQIFLDTIKTFRITLKRACQTIVHSLENKTFIPKIPLEIKSTKEDLPNISIITLTHERPEFIELMKLNYLGIDYPRDKLEWIIYDDSKEPLENYEEVLKECEHCKYVHLTDKLTIGKKRNMAIEQSNHNIIAFMDDDDIYYPRNLLIRLSFMTFYKKQCVGCSTLGNFDINRIISHINVPPLSIPYHQRISEASLMFYKEFWKECPFPDTSHNEGSEFLKNRYSSMVEINWKHVMLSLNHFKNISNRNKCIESMEPNGCHFGLSDDLFKYLINLQKYNIEY